MYEDYLQEAMGVIKRMELREQQGIDPYNDAGNPNSPLHDYSRAFKGAGDYIPQSLHEETMAQERKQKKGASTITIPGFQFQMDENGDITILQTGSHYTYVSANQAQAYRDAINALVPAPDPAVIDINTQSVVPGNSMGQMSQNERTALYLKAQKGRRGY